MSLFAWLRAAKPQLDATQQRRLAQLPKPAPLSEGALRSQRWVVVDLETSGLNLNRDQVLSIGAVVIEDGAVDFSQLFERTLQRPETKLSPSVLIHGLGPSAIAAGSDGDAGEAATVREGATMQPLRWPATQWAASVAGSSALVSVALAFIGTRAGGGGGSGGVSG